MPLHAKKRLILIVLAVLMLAASPSVVSIGISSSPLQNPYFFQPGIELSLDMRCIEFTDDCEPYLVGAFAGNSEIKDIKDTGPKEKSFRVIIKLPQEEPAGGMHTLYIGVTDIEKSAASGISTITKVRKAVNFLVLYEGAYVEAAFSAKNINTGEKGRFSFSVSNYGKQDLSNVYGMIGIFNSKNEMVGSARTESARIRSTESGTISSEWDSAGNEAGEYLAAGTLFYEGEKKEMNQSFLIGIKDVALINYTRDFDAGRIGRMDILVENRWNGPISQLFAAVMVGGTEFRTPSISMDAFQSAVLTGYLDAASLEPGEHDAEIALSFDGIEKRESGKISINRLGQERKPLNIGLNMTTLLVAVIMLLVLFNIVMLLRLRRRK